MKRQALIDLPAGGSFNLKTPQTELQKTDILTSLLYDDWVALRAIVRELLIDHSFTEEDGSQANWRDVCDYVLTPTALTQIVNQILSASQVPQEDLDEIRLIGVITGSGGCECKICKGLVDNPDEREVSYCRYGKIKERPAILFNLTATHFGQLNLQSPQYIWQVKRVFENGQREAIKIQKKKDKDKAEVDALLGI